MSGWNGVSRWMPGKDSAWITGLLLAVLVQNCNSERSRADLIRAEFLSGIGETRTATGDVRTELLDRIDQSRAELVERIDQSRAELGSRIDQSRAELLGRIDQSRAESAAARTELLDRIDRNRSESAAARTELLDRIDRNRTELLEQIDRNRSESAAARSELLGRIDQLFGAVIEIGENIARMDERQAQAQDPDRDEAQEGTVR